MDSQKQSEHRENIPRVHVISKICGKILRIAVFLICCAIGIIPFLFSLLFSGIEILILLLICGVPLLICGIFWHALFLTSLGFWPAVIADIVLVVYLLIDVIGEKRIEDKDAEYRSELRAKEIRGEHLESWEYETIHPKISANVGVFDVILGLMIWDFFSSKKD